ncbi:MAG: hypothetical protein NTV33_10960 [Coprothermobacterota bacterium]|nr:hypothetical protein [Coprothermobacterota bacterium]
MKTLVITQCSIKNHPPGEKVIIDLIIETDTETSSLVEPYLFRNQLDAAVAIAKMREGS